MNSEELVSTPTCLHTQSLPKFPVSSLLPANITKDANVTSLSTPGWVVTMTTTVHTHQMPFQSWNLPQILSQSILLAIMSRGTKNPHQQILSVDILQGKQPQFTQAQRQHANQEMQHLTLRPCDLTL